MSSKPFSILGLGTIVVDHQVILRSFPEPDTKAEVLSDRFQVGGPVPTALCLLRQFGCSSHFLGQWARDQFGDMIEADLQARHVTFDPPESHDNARTGFAHVWIEKSTGRRTTSAFRGSHELNPARLQQLKFDAHDALHLDGWHGQAAISAARTVQSRGGRVFMDLGSPKPKLEELLSHVSLLSCPHRLLQQLFDSTDLDSGARRLLALGPSQVLVTLGAEGAHLFTTESHSNHPGFKVNAVDTNGAGDVFVGAVIFGSMQGWPPPKQLEFACAAAALKCTQLGNRAALPTLNQIETFLTQSTKR